MDINNEPLFTTPDEVPPSKSPNPKTPVGLGPVTTNFFRNLLNRLNNDHKNTLTQNLIDPMMDIINQKIKPYIYVSIGMYLLIVLLLVYLIWLILKRKC